MHAEALESAPCISLHPALDPGGNGLLVATALAGRMRGLVRETFGEKD